jgi:uncharacterized membrane protein
MKKYFITGLAILLPLAVTIGIVIFIVDFLTKPFVGLVVKFLSDMSIKELGIPIISSEKFILYGSQIIILIGLFLFTLGLGIIARWFLFNSLLRLSDKILHKIPIVNKVYKTTQEIIKTLFITDKNSFKQVVLIPFPNEDSYSLGLVSRTSPNTCNAAVKTEMISVFVPTTPNPTTGFLLMFKKEDLIFLDMKTEDAVKYIVSCGVIIPGDKKDDLLSKKTKEK